MVTTMEISDKWRARIKTAVTWTVTLSFTMLLAWMTALVGVAIWMNATHPHQSATAALSLSYRP